MGILRTAIAPAILILVLAGCTVGPDYVPPEIRTPDDWDQEMAEGLEQGEAGYETWWTAFGDPVLDALIQRAQEGNLNLKVAVSRVREARARRRFQAAGWAPQVNGVGAMNYGKTSESAQPVLPSGVHRTDMSYTAGFDATWELDVWGRISRAVESADAEIQATVEDWRDLQVILFSEVALGYLEVRALQARIRYAEANVKSQQGSLDLTKNRLAAEIAPELDVRQAELNLASTEAGIPVLRALLVVTINRISVLLGEHPGSLKKELMVPAEIPAPPGQVFVGLPANLLRQRPDVRAAERRLAAQTARIGVATADLYPKFRIDGFLTQQTVGTAGGFFSPDNTAWAIAPGFSWNLFNGGRVRAVITVEDERTKQALFSYEQTVLLALEEVENALTGYLREQERVAALDRAVVAAERSVELSRTLYRTGITDFQNVLDMERELTRQQDSLAASEGIVAQRLVQLYKALGGGWNPDDSLPDEEDQEDDEEEDEASS